MPRDDNPDGPVAITWRRFNRHPASGSPQAAADYIPAALILNWNNGGSKAIDDNADYLQAGNLKRSRSSLKGWDHTGAAD
jgi:hypothetical protein